MRVFLIIQGEGRGHLSQAISYCESRPEIEVCGVIVSDQGRENPFNLNKIFDHVPVIKLKSLSLKYKNSKINILGTILHNIIGFPLFINNLFMVDKWVRHLEPDLILNFYEPLSIGSIFTGINKHSISNQYLFNIKQWERPKDFFIDSMIKIWNNITSIGSNKIISPSFIDIPNNSTIEIRKKVIDLIPKKYNFTLVYLIDKDSVLEFIEYASSVKRSFILFTDQGANIDFPNNIEYNILNDDLFLHKLECCDGVICNGGFQLISEAIYLDKYVRVIPLHFEQLSNAYNLNVMGKGSLLK